MRTRLSVASVIGVLSGLTPTSVASAQDSWVNVMPEGYVVTGTNTVNVTIEWCAHPPHMFDPNTRVFRLNNVDVSANFTTQYVNDVPNCGGPNQADDIGERSTGTITLSEFAYSNHLEAWVFDINGFMYGDNEYYVTPSIERGVTVTADAQAAKVPPSTSGLTQKFTVWNVGSIQDTFLITPTCSGVAAGGSCSASPGQIALNSTASGSVTVTYTSKALGQVPNDTGLIRLQASRSTNAAMRDSSWTDVTLAPPPPAGATLLTTGPIIERDLCVAMALGSAAASECGDLRLVHPLPPTRTLNRVWAPLLMYNSQHANPAPIVQADVTLPTGTTDSVQLRLLIASVERGKGRWVGWTGAQTRRISVMDTTGSLAEGVYTYTLEVRRKSGGTWSTLATPTGSFSVVRRDASAFGAGWWLAGLERLNVATMLWISGEGSVRQYTSAGTNLWVAPNVDHPDTLKLEGSYYVRYLSNNLRVKFNASGQHVQTVNRLGQITVFGYDTCGRLSVIKLAPDTTSRIYQFTYSSPTDCLTRLVSVTAPPIAGASRTTTITNTSGRVMSIRDPDNNTVSFAYETGTNRVISRTDRRSKITTYTYDAGKRMAAFRVPVWAADVVMTSAQSRGLASFGAAQPPDSAYAMIDGPRTDVTDVTKFWVNAYGAPTRIRNAVLRETQLTYDATWPALVVKVRAPNLFVTQAWYNARALLDSTKALNPLGDGRNSKTTYTWHATWAMPTNVTSPAGVITNFGYDATTGNRLWQELGSSAHRVNFAYNSSGQVIAVTQPGLPPESLFYDAIGNLHRTKSSLGLLSLCYADAIGRDTMVATPLSMASAGDTTQAFVSWGRTRTVYDIMGRVSRMVTWGPQVTAPGGRVHAADSVRVENSYDFEGNLTGTTRFYPAGGFFTALGSSWTYDDANRVTRENSSGHALETIYTLDPAGNRMTITTARGLSITTQYDAMNRPVKRMLPEVDYNSTSCTAFVPPGVPCVHTFPTRDGPTVCIRADTAVFGYDHVGNMVRADNWAAKVRRSYTPSGLPQEDTLRIRTYTTFAPGSSPCEAQNPDTLPEPIDDFSWHVYALRSTYNLDGRRDTLYHPTDIDPCASRCRDRYVYEAATGWLDKMYNAKDSLIDFTYDAAGRQTQVRYPGGASGVTIVQAYDADGRRIVRSGFGIYDSLAYDARSKVIGGTAWDATWGARSITVTYNGLGAVVYAEAMNSAAGIEEFRLDALGNRVWQRDVGLNSEYNDRCRNNTIDGLGRLTQITLDLVNCPPPPPSYAYEHNSSYDGMGNVSATYGKHNVGANLVYNQALSYYDADDKLRVFNSMDVGNQVFEQYRYDALGRRVFVRSRTTDGTAFGYAERTVWDGAQILYEIRAIGGDSAVWGEMEYDDPSGSGQYAGKVGRVGYSHGGAIDRPVTVFRSGTAVVPYVDWRGTPATGSYMDGTATSGACPPFPAGRTTVDGEKASEPCAEWWGSLMAAQTDGSGLEYMRNRYYDPRTGRFTQEDPVGLAGGLNFYGFASGDPLNFSDPFGLCRDDDTVCKGFVGQLRSMKDAPLVQSAADLLDATQRQVRVVRSNDRGLDPEGVNSDGRKDTYAFGRTDFGSIYINGDVGQATQLMAVAHEALYHNENTRGPATDPKHTYYGGKIRDVPLAEQFARNGVVARGYIWGLINDRVPGAEGRLKRLLNQ
jgi:RHS repeat-associated protein